MSSSLQQLLDNPDATINVIVSLTSVNRSSGTSATWYFSRFADSALAGGSITNSDLFYPYLRSVGPLSKSLSEDVLFGDLAGISPGSITLLQESAAVDRLSALADYTFEGYIATVKIGELGVDNFSTGCYTLFTATIDQEPQFDLVTEGVRVTINLSSITSRMEKELISSISRYVGAMHCIRHQTTTGIATATRIAAYDLSTFTIMLRFRTVTATAPTGNVPLFRKRVSDSDANWNIRMVAGSGVVNFNASGAGVANDINLNDDTNFADGEWHTVIAARYLTTFAYLVIDGVQRGSDSTLSAADLSVANVQFGVLNNSADDVEICDVRIYNRFFYQDDAVVLSSVLVDTVDQFLIAYWKCDDNTGGTVNDYSSNNNDATLAGVLNTDYAWKPTYLGGPELSGKPYPFTLGIPFNCPAHLIDTNRQIHRVNPSNLETNNRTVNLKSRGVALVQTTDYTDNSDGTFTMVSAEDEPVTFDVTQSPRDYHNTAPRIMYDLWELLGTTGEDGYEAMIAMSNLMSGAIGYFSDESPTYGEVTKKLIGGIGGNCRESANGYPMVDFLLPPIDMSPYDTPCIDFGGHPNNINFGNKANITSSHTICAWFKTFAIDQSADSSTPGINQTIVYKPNAWSVYYYMADTNSGKIVVEVGQSSIATVSSSTGLITDGVWYFIAEVYDDAANTLTLYIAAEGSTLVQIAQTTGATPTVGTGNDLSTGFTVWGSTHGIHIWDVAKNLSQLQALMTTPPVGNESNLIFYAPMSEGTGSLTYDKVSGSSATQGYYNRWSPMITINLNDTPSVKLTEFRHIAPAWKIIVKYYKNWNKMSSADINTSVSQSSRIDLMREWRELPWFSNVNKTRYKRAKQIIFESCFTEQSAAARLLRMMIKRFGTDRYIAMLDLPSEHLISRRCFNLELGDEVRLISAAPTQLASGRSMRVVARTMNPMDLSCKIGLWG